MDTHTPNFKIRLGLFVIAGFVLLGIAIFYIGKQNNLFDPVFTINTTFYNVSGLMVGNNIRFSGINIGTVDEIKIINDSTVQVAMVIRKNVQEFIKSDSEASIGSEGIIGDKIVVITQGSIDSPIVEDGQRIDSVEPIEMDAIMASMSNTAMNVEIISHQLSSIMVDINQGKGTLGRLIRDTDIADNISQTSVNLERGSKGFNVLIDQVNNKQGTIGKLLHDSSIADNINQTMTNLESGTKELSEIIVQLNSGQGTLGKLINDPTLENTITQTMINIEKTTKGLEETIEAAKHSFLLKGAFNRKKRAEEKKVNDEQKAAEIAVKNAEKEAIAAEKKAKKNE